MLRYISLVIFQSLLVLVVTNNATSTGPHIADVNILLPPRMTHPVEYRLQGSDGCFKWSWDHHDVLSVVPEYNLSSHCSTSAHLKSIAPYSGRKETAVYATDVQTGMVIRCKVYIDNFSRIQIFHNSIKLDLGGLATLRVRAFDSEENVFSSLVGLQFMWQLTPETDGLPHHLVHVPLKESPLGDCGGLCGDLDIQIRLEDSGVFSDLYVVKGTEIGHENVSVHLLEPLYELVEDKIVLTVAEAMSLDPPSPVFVLVGAVIRYTLKVIRGNTPQLVTLPSSFHRWSVLNSSVAEMDTMMGVAYALSLGVTTVSVEDTRVPGHVQMSSLHVVQPDSLSLYIIPLPLSGDPLEEVIPIPSVSRWYIVSGRRYLIHVKAFSRGQEIYITESDDAKLLEDQPEYWNVYPVSDGIDVKHGWWNSRILEATSYGLGKLTASLTYNGGNKEKEVLKVVEEVMVCDQVKFSMGKRSVSQNILLPWAPSVHQEMELKATGGCAMRLSDYKWFSSDMAIVSVSASGVVQAKKPGTAIVKVTSIFDSLNYDEVVIEVAIPSSMVMLPIFPVETAVGSCLPASVTLKASNGAYFLECDAFCDSVMWKTGSESFTIVNATLESFISEEQKSLYGPPCSWTHVHASSSGRTMLHVTITKEYLSFDHFISGSIALKASSHIAAYLPLIVHQAGDGNQFGGYWFSLAQAEAHKELENLNVLYMVPGTHIDVMLRGGPEKWDQGVEYIEAVEVSSEEHAHPKDGVLVHQISTGYGSPYRISCQDLGYSNLVFKRGNLVGDDHPLPAIAEVEMLLKCAFPSAIALIADEAVNALEVIQTASLADRSSGRVRAMPITLANGRTIRVSAVGISDTGKAFGNSSSLCLRWELSDCDGLASWDDASSLITTKCSWEQFLVLHNSSGLCIVRATVVGFTDTSNFGSLESVLTDALRIQLVSTLRVEPEFNLLFFGPDAKLNLTITGGSCFLETAVNDTQILDVLQPPRDSQCSQLVLAPKGFGTASVAVYDVGLAPPLAASAMVHVADVDWIKIISGEEISLVEGSSRSIHLLAGTDVGNTFDSSQYIYMNIRVHIEDHIVALMDSYDGYVKEPSFTIRAGHLGITILYLSARQHSGHEILSQPIKVEVYAAPSIHPSDIFLVPGASYVLSLKGGPTVGAYVEYASMDDEISTIQKSSGRLLAIAPGNTSVVATVYGNGDVVICQAYGRVKVGVPSSVILDVQSEQLAVGHEMPIFPSFSEGDLFSFYELCKNYEWTVVDEDVLSFQVAALGQDLGFIKTFYGRSGGSTRVAVSFTCDFSSSGFFSEPKLYSASVSLSVVADLPLALGAPMTWVLPPHYTSSNLLPSSSSSQGDAQRRKGTIAYSMLREFGGKNEEAHIDAVSIDEFKIKTRGSNSLACIQAKDRLTGRTEVASCVRVAEVAQIRITTKVFPLHMINLPVGAEFNIPVIYCDVLGIPFHEAYNLKLFDTETNYRDVVLINDKRDGNGNIRLKAMHHGRALVRTSLSSNPQKSDYMMVVVGSHLYPQNPVLHLGTSLNFTIEGLSDQIPGRWSSANASVIAIDTLSGKAEAVGEGATQVSYEGSSMKVHTLVTVLKGNIVSIDAPKEKLTNAPVPKNGYRFSVKFSDAYKHNHEAGGDGSDIMHDCRVDPPLIGYARAWRDLETGNSYCLFFPYPAEHFSPLPQDTRRVMPVSISTFLKGANHISASVTAPLVGGFNILEMDDDQDTFEMYLAPNYNWTLFTIVGNTDVEVNWQDHNQLLVTLVHLEDYGFGGYAQYKVAALKGTRFKDKVTITLRINGQKAELGVSYEPGKEEAKPTARTTNATLWGVVVASFALLILAVAVFIGYLDRAGRSQPTISPATPIVPAPVTPDRSSSGAKDQSPRTPQPFIDYVRRTIDETPYYRQEARRRFNPQNTF
ncbi:hypothetical protein RJ639_035695 [Escallonia herrerae]|uniref:BIG2 domain-containing protein n=1 Tax=Escallonia herrerae TaxID=1293975 RepID=A0AA88WTW7_9ASTE|nr:hypothetical protein RJ639_035695 [Escallonia herrerae]